MISININKQCYKNNKSIIYSKKPLKSAQRYKILRILLKKFCEFQPSSSFNPMKNWLTKRLQTVHKKTLKTLNLYSDNNAVQKFTCTSNLNKKETFYFSEK